MVTCASCGQNDIVAFSCKRRGVCPSCNARGMGNGAAHLVDHVLPAVPYRQWVVGFPFELNGPLAFQPGLLAATERIVVDALRRWQKARAGAECAGGRHPREAPLWRFFESSPALAHSADGRRVPQQRRWRPHLPADTATAR